MNTGSGLRWGNLVHLSFNMWSDRQGKDAYMPAKAHLQFDDNLWEEMLREMVKAGVNMVVLDLGDGIRYESHPEISVKGAWSPARLRRELERMRRMGIEPIPKMNFSACHDHWLGPYSRRVSTPEYYKACADLIAEAIRLFGRPRLFHLGLDEETSRHQKTFRYVVVRQHDLWWHDFHFFRRQVARHGVRPWIWSDYVWNHPKEFYREVPRSVLQSNWYYAASFSPKVPYVKAYLDLNRRGYDQIPTGTALIAEDWAVRDSFPRTVRFCAKHIPRRLLKGFLQTLWMPTTRDRRREHLAAIGQIRKGIEIWRKPAR